MDAKKMLACACKIARKAACWLLSKIEAVMMPHADKILGATPKGGKKSPIRSLLVGAGSSTWYRGFRWIGLWGAVVVFLLGVTLGSVLRSFLSVSWVVGFLLLAIGGFIWFCRRKKIVDEIENSMLGYRGERAVADTLVHFTRTNWCVFHDFRIPGKNWNIDHIVVCPRGVICIETKTMRRYEDETRKLRFDGKRVFWGTDSSWRPLPWDPVEKVERYAEQMKEFLRKEGIQLGDDSVTPMIIYPGWEFTEDSVDNGKIIVGNRKKISFLISLGEQGSKLSDHKIMEIAKVLKPKNEFPLDD